MRNTWEEEEEEKSAETAFPCKALPEDGKTNPSCSALWAWDSSRMTAEMGTMLMANPSRSLIWRVWYPWDPSNKLNLEGLHRPHGRQSPILLEYPPGLPGSSTAGTLLRGLCVTTFTVSSDSLLGRLVVSCSGITAFGSGKADGRDG